MKTYGLQIGSWRSTALYGKRQESDKVAPVITEQHKDKSGLLITLWAQIWEMRGPRGLTGLL